MPNASTPLRLVAGTREELRARLIAHFWGKPRPHEVGELADDILNALGLTPPKPGEEPMTVGGLNLAVAAGKSAFRGELHNQMRRIEQEVRRATGE